MYQNGDLIVPINFQRKYVWDIKRASTLIESFLLGLPVPGIFLYLTTDRKYMIIDGQQRILSIAMFINRFFDGKGFEKKDSDDKSIEFELQDVQKDWNGHTYKELSDEDKRNFDNSILRATIVQQIEPDDNESIFHIFERLNTGGVNLNPMQIRMCVYNGKMMDLLLELNAKKEWRRIIGQKNEDINYFDIELILRMFALQEYFDEYKSPMKKFLNDYCGDLNSDKSKLLNNDKSTLDTWVDKKRQLFEKVVNDILKIDNKLLFFKGKKFSLTVFDAIAVALMKLHNDDDKYTLKDGINKDSFLNNTDFVASIDIKYNTAGRDNIKKRIEKALDILK